MAGPLVVSPESNMQVRDKLYINGGPFNRQAPFGGFKKSGTGRDLGRFGLDEFLEYKSLQLKPEAKA